MKEINGGSNGKRDQPRFFLSGTHLLISLAVVTTGRRLQMKGGLPSTIAESVSHDGMCD